MTLFASPSLFILAIISIALAYFIGVKQYTWLLSGFNERRVPDKVKLSKIVGLYNLTAGVITTIGSVFSTPNVKILVPIIIIGHVIIAAYVNTRMVH
ncbi:exonuclease [Bacillus anthracis]|nr:exonuclease [Bacillus anthracis]